MQKNRKYSLIKITSLSIILSVVLFSCQTDPYGSHWSGEESLTIYQFLEQNHDEYSKFISLLDKGKLLGTLSAYNPYGEDYTLFLPTNEAIDNFIGQNQNYNTMNDMLQDTSFIYMFTRYHVVKRKVHTDEFPYGALADSTLTGDRLAIGFYTDGENQLIKVNNEASILKSNLNMTNGYINVISEVLQKSDISGYEWLQQHNDYSILANAMDLTGINKRLWWNKYTILAEHDSVFHKKGIQTVDDLINRIATPGMPFTNTSNPFYQFAAYHILAGEYYLNDLRWGSNNYSTLGKSPLVINVGVEIKINPGVETFGVKVSETGDTTLINYISPVWENCNIVTGTGPVHSITEILNAEPLP